MPTVTIDYTPRVIQEQIHAALDTQRFGVVVAHRRMGKSVCAVNHLIRAALTMTRDRPRFAYLAPTYTMAKAIIWDYAQHYSRPIPGTTFNQSELRIDYPNGGQLRLYGADSPDSLRGIYLDGCVLDEFGLMPPKIFSEVLRPALSDRKGWAFFIGTPAGKNQFYDLAQRAKADPAWFFYEFKASQTGVLDAAELAAARADMTQDARYERDRLAATLAETQAKHENEAHDLAFALAQERRDHLGTLTELNLLKGNYDRKVDECRDEYRRADAAERARDEWMVILKAPSGAYGPETARDLLRAYMDEFDRMKAALDDRIAYYKSTEAALTTLRADHERLKREHERLTDELKTANDRLINARGGA